MKTNCERNIYKRNFECLHPLLETGKEGRTIEICSISVSRIRGTIDMDFRGECI